MAQYRPSLDDLLRTIQAFVDGLIPTLDGEPRYHAQVSSYLLGIGERELRLAQQYDAQELEELRAFLGEDGGLPELTEKLCTGIRAGNYDNRWDEVMNLVLDQVVRNVRIVKPSHLDPMHREA